MDPLATINDFLPKEVLTKCFAFLPPEDMVSASKVCHLWNEIANHKSHWISFALDRFQLGEFKFSDRVFVQLVHKCERSQQMMDGYQQNIQKVIELAPKFETCPEEFLERVTSALLVNLAFISASPFPGGILTIEGEPEFPRLEGYLNSPKYKYVHQNGGASAKHVLLALQLYLIMGFESKDGAVRASALLGFKRIAVDFIHHGTVSGFLNGSPYVYVSVVRSLLHALTKTYESPKKAAQDIIQIFQLDHRTVQKIVREMPSGEFKRAAFTALADFCKKFLTFQAEFNAESEFSLISRRFSEIYGSAPSAEQTEQLWLKKAVLSLSKRKASPEDVESLVEKLRIMSYWTSFEGNGVEFIRISVRGLIALSQKDAASFGSTKTYANILPQQFRYFQNLNNYLSNPKYSYVANNDQQSTSTFRKAAVLYLIQGLESEEADIREAAIDGFSQLASDYLKYGFKEIAGEQYLAAIFEIARGYFDAEDDVDMLCQTLRSIFLSDKSILQKLVAALPEGDKREMLAVAVSKI